MIEWRPVDCDTRQPLPFDPAYIDKSVIYKGGPRPGWSWFPQQASNATLITAAGGFVLLCTQYRLLPAVFHDMLFKPCCATSGGTVPHSTCIGMLWTARHGPVAT